MDKIIKIILKIIQKILTIIIITSSSFTISTLLICTTNFIYEYSKINNNTIKFILFFGLGALLPNLIMFICRKLFKDIIKELID